MKGLTINGYLVVEVLGSGQAGILYLARNEEGREAIVRVARDGEDNVSIRVFQEEAAQLLPSIDSVVTSESPDGRRVLMATPPGAGASRYAETQRLSLRAPGPLLRRPTFLLLLASVALVAASVVFFLLSRESRSAPGPTAPAAVAATALSATSPAPVVIPATRQAEPDAGSTPAEAVADAPAPTRAATRPTPHPDCTPDDRWKRMMHLNLQELDARANALEAIEVERAVISLATAVEGASTKTDCASVMTRFDALVKRAIKPGG